MQHNVHHNTDKKSHVANISSSVNITGNTTTNLYSIVYHKLYSVNSINFNNVENHKNELIKAHYCEIMIELINSC